MTVDLEQRLVEVERRLSYAERTAEDLSAVVAGQAREIERLTLKIAALVKRIEETASWEPSSQDDKPPPHY